MIRMTTAAVLALAGSALAQYEITIDVENPTLLPGESTVITMYAGFGRPDHAMAGVATNLISSAGGAGLSDALVVGSMAGPGTSAGMPSATGYDAITAGQLQFAGAGIWADPTNPIAFWQVTYTAPADVVDPFDAMLSTRTTRYDVFIDDTSSTSESRLADLTEGAATIRVIPAPASASLLALALMAMRRRR